MQCPKCRSNNVSTQVINTVTLKTQHHSVLWWILLGWYWVPLKWLFLTLPALIVKIFGHKKQKAVNKQKTVCVCQDCGHTWDL